MKRGKLNLWSIVILLFYITIFFSCEKKEEVKVWKVTTKPRTPPLEFDYSIVEEFENAFSETKWEGSGYLDKMTPSVMTGYRTYERADKFKGGNIFAVQNLIDEAFFNENVFIKNINFTPENKDELETIYYKYISGYLNSIFSEDRVNDLNVLIDPSNSGIKVSVNIDGEWKFKSDKNGKYILLPDGTIDREYIPVSYKDIKEVDEFIKELININSNENNSVTIRNIPVDRTSQFAEEDAAYFKQQKYFKKAVFISLIGLIIVSLFCSVAILKYKQKIINMSGNIFMEGRNDKKN